MNIGAGHVQLIRRDPICVVQALDDLDLKFPKVSREQKKALRRARKELEG